MKTDTSQPADGPPRRLLMCSPPTSNQSLIRRRLDHERDTLALRGGRGQPIRGRRSRGGLTRGGLPRRAVAPRRSAAPAATTGAARGEPTWGASGLPSPDNGPPRGVNQPELEQPSRAEDWSVAATLYSAAHQLQHEPSPPPLVREERRTPNPARLGHGLIVLGAGCGHPPRSPPTNQAHYTIRSWGYGLDQSKASSFLCYLTLASSRAFRLPCRVAEGTAASACGLAVGGAAAEPPSIHPGPATCPPPRRRASRRMPGATGAPLTPSLAPTPSASIQGRATSSPARPLGPDR